MKSPQTIQVLEDLRNEIMTHYKIRKKIENNHMRLF